MSDNIQIRDGNEDLTVVATEDLGGREVQLVKIGFGVSGSYQNITNSNPLPVSGNFGSDNVSATILNYPSTQNVNGIVGVSGINEVSGTVSINNFPSVQAVSGNLSVQMSATDLQFDGVKVTSSNPLPVVGNFDVTFPETQNVSGSVSAYVINQVSEINSNVLNFPNIQGVSGNISATILNFPNSQNINGIIGVSGTSNISGTVSVSNFPSNQNVNGVVGISGTPLISATITNFPSVQVVSGNLSVEVSATDLQYNGTKVTNANPLPVSGNFGVTFPTTQNVSGSVSATISNFPSTQNIQGVVGVSGSHGVSGSVSATITNFPSTQNVVGTVGLSAAISANILNYPSTQNINGIVGISGNHAVSGTVSATILNLPNSQNVNGIVGISGTHAISGTVSINNFPSVQAVSGNVTVDVSATDLQFDGTKVTSANPLPILGDVNTTEKANLINYWPNMESIETEKVELNVDPSGALQVRGSFTTDEGSYSTDFTGNSIYTILSGTCIFENGSTTVSGIGTSFLSQLSYGDFIKLSSDPLIDYTRIVTIISNTELQLEYGYTGTTTNGVGYFTGFEQIIEGDASLDVDRSLLIINGGSQSNSLAQVSRVVDFLPTAGVLRNFRFSQNTPQTDCFFGFFDTHDYRTSNVAAYVIFLEAQTAQLITKTSNSSYDTNVVTFTLPNKTYIYTPARWKFEVADDKVSVYYNDILLATSNNHLPPIYKPLNFNIGVFNKTVPETPVILYLDEILFKNVDVINTASVLQSHVQMSYDSEANAILKELTSTMNSLQATLKSYASIMGMSVDINGRQRMNVETGTITASIASAQTLATVTTCGTVTTLTGQTNIGSYAANDMVPSNLNNSALLLRQNIVIS